VFNIGSPSAALFGWHQYRVIPYLTWAESENVIEYSAEIAINYRGAMIGWCNYEWHWIL